MTASICFPSFFAAAVRATLVSRHFESRLTVLASFTYMYFPPFLYRGCHSVSIPCFLCFPHFASRLISFVIFFSAILRRCDCDRYKLRLENSAWNKVSPERNSRSICKVSRAHRKKHTLLEMNVLLGNVRGIGGCLNDVRAANGFISMWKIFQHVLGLISLKP